MKRKLRSAKKRASLTKKQQKAIAVASIVLFIALTTILAVLIGKPMLSFASKPELFREWVDSNGIAGRIAYFAMVFIQVLVAIIPGEPLEILGGYAFGAFEGTVLCLAAAFSGSIVVFLLVRKLGTRLVEVFFPPERLETLRFLQTSTKRDFLFFIIFMVPGTPKDLLCYFAGLTKMRTSLWLIICSVGRVPSVITSTVGGSALGTKSYWFAVAVFAATLLVSAIGFKIYSDICKRNDRSDDENAQNR